MKGFKKVTALALIVALCAAMVLPASAAQTEAPRETAQTQDAQVLPIVFVTGIGQLWSHLLNEDGSYKTEVTKDGKTEPIEYNLFYADLDALKQPKNAAALVRVALQLLVLSPLFDHNFLSKRDLQTVISAVFNRNIIDENGNLPADVEPAARNYPVSEYSETDKYNFYFSIPCKSVLGEIGEQNVYCYYHSAFSFLERDADGLDTFINDVVLKDRTDVHQVVLVPMSMGAAVVSDYLARYGDKGQVKRVVSVVGAWNGSDLVADLIEGKYAQDAPELLYHSLLPQLVPDPWGHLIDIFLYAFPKRVLRSIVDTILSSVVETMVLRTPSLLSLIPAERYPAIEQAYLSDSRYDDIRRQTRAYYEAQRTLTQRMAQLEAQGTEFYFLCGYGLGFGAFDNDFCYFRFMESAPRTNSDEIIQISSTAPGAAFAPAGQSLGRTGQYVSPDGSVDLSASFAPDRTWLFYRQRHQLDYNNTALRLAMEIATGRVTDVQSSADRFPQFNELRNARDLLKGNDTLLDKLQRFITQNADDPQRAADVARAQEALDACEAMLARTHNDPQADDAVIADAWRVLSQVDPAPAPPQQPAKRSDQIRDAVKEKLMDFLKKVLPEWHERLYRKYGAQGRADYRPFG